MTLDNLFCARLLGVVTLAVNLAARNVDRFCIENIIGCHGDDGLPREVQLDIVSEVLS